MDAREKNRLYQKEYYKRKREKLMEEPSRLAAYREEQRTKAKRIREEIKTVPARLEALRESKRRHKKLKCERIKADPERLAEERSKSAEYQRYRRQKIKLDPLRRAADQEKRKVYLREKFKDPAVVDRVQEWRRKYEARKRQEGDLDWLLKRRVIYYKRNAKVRGLSWLLTDDEAKWFFQQECHYCGMPPNPLNGIDRINNDKCYDLDTIVSACWPCNEEKKAIPYDHFVKLPRIAMYRQSLVVRDPDDSDATE